MARRMKDSGIEWIGIIPDTWDVKPIKTCFKERNEKVSDYEWEPLSVTKQGIVRQLESAAKSDAHDARKKVCRGDFVINSRSDRKQSCGLSDYDGSVSLINIVLKSEKVFNGYVKYLLKNYGFAEEFYRWGTGIVADLWSTNFQRMKKIMIPIPPHDEQEKIANYLDEKIPEIDSFISKTKESIEEYKKYKQAVISEVVNRSLDSDVPMKDSGIEWIGKIPTEYSVIKLKYIADIVRGGSPRPAGDLRYYEGNIPFMKISDITKDDGIYVDSCVGSIKEAGLSNTRMVEADTLLLTNSGATLGVPKINTFKTTFNDGIAAFLNLDSKIDIVFAYYALKSKTKYFLEVASMGMGQPNLNTDIIGATHIVIPPMEEQKRIVKFLVKKSEDIDNLIAKKEAFVEEMEAYKKSLIYEYVTGKKEVL